MNFLRTNIGRFFLFAVLSLGAVVFLSACDDMKKNNDKNIVDVIKYFDKEGLKVEKIQPSACEIIVAQEGCMLIISGQPVEIYKYDRTLDRPGKVIEKMGENGHVFISGMKFPVIVNGSFVLLNYENHPQKDEIIGIFQSF